MDRRLRTWPLLLVAALGLLGGAAPFLQVAAAHAEERLVAAAPAQPVAPKPVDGVQWDGQTVRATGSGAPDLRASNPAQKRLGAERAAQMDALRNLLAQVRGIEISAGKTVGDSLASDEVRGKVEGVLRGFRILAKRYFSDGGVEMDVEVPLAALTEVLVEPGEAIDPPKPETPAPAAGKKATGLVVDARGLKVTPALAPKLLDEGGKPLYGPGSLSADARKSAVVASYVQSIDDAKRSRRAGEKPLVVKAARSEGTDLILSKDEARKLAETSGTYLAEGRVVIVTGRR